MVIASGGTCHAYRGFRGPHVPLARRVQVLSQIVTGDGLIPLAATAVLLFVLMVGRLYDRVGLPEWVFNVVLVLGLFVVWLTTWSEVFG